MEHEGTVSEASWGSFDPSVPVEDSEVMAQLLGPHYFANENEQKTTMFWPHHDSNSNFDSSNFHNNCSSNYWSTRLNVGPNSNASANSFLYSGGPSYEGYYLSDPNAMPLIDEDQMVNSSLEIGLGNNFEKQSGDENVNKRKLCLGEEDEKDETSTVFSKRKSRASMLTPKRAKNSKCKKAQKSGEEDGNGELNSSGYSSEDDSNESPDINKENEISRPKKSNQNGKSRANRGSATDPQSLYARKRRERINERLKILQNLVPNGTKVDISTMLEEAVQYVKFLQLQIKLLSSDELWMYAPIAYNGMNLGLDLRIAPPQQ